MPSTRGKSPFRSTSPALPPVPDDVTNRTRMPSVAAPPVESPEKAGRCMAKSDLKCPTVGCSMYAERTNRLVCPQCYRSTVRAIYSPRTTAR